MLIVKLNGGLGNQMFQYAFARALAIKYHVPIYLDLDNYNEGSSGKRPYALDVFSLAPDVLPVSSLMKTNNGIEQVIELEETGYSFDESATRILDNEPAAQTAVIITGYWQSYKYLEPAQLFIRNDFRFKHPLYGKWEELNRSIISRNAVMINVRRAEYLTLLDYHGVVSAEYIQEGMEICRKRVVKPFFYVFSDDIPWCKAHIKEAENVFFVDETYYDEKFQFYMQLMSNCKYFIIANSSFAWWAAWLSSGKEKFVIYPKRWVTTDALDTADLCPPDWIAL